MLRRILRTPEAASYCGVSPSTLEKRRLTGDGPSFVRLGKRCVGYRVEDLDAWIDREHEVGDGATGGRADANPASADIDGT